MMPGARFTFLFDRTSRTAVAALISSLERAAGPSAEGGRTAGLRAPGAPADSGRAASTCPGAGARAVLDTAGPQAAGLIRAVPMERAGEIGFDPGLREFLCMSSMTANFPERESVLAALRRNHGGAFESILGGPHASGDPRGALEAGFDYCCVGEGEETVRDIRSRALSGLALDGIAGLMRMAGGKVEGAGRERSVDLDGFEPLPGSVRFPTYIEVGRGCRWGCAYCQTPRMFGRQERYRSPERVERTVARYSRWGMKDVRLLLPNALAYGSPGPGEPCPEALDDLLGRARSACGDGRVFLGSFPSEVRPDYVTPEAVAVLRRYVSNDSMVIGGQSGSDRVLRALGRGHGAEETSRAARIAMSGGFAVSVDLMLGFPFEDPEDREATFELAESLGRQGARVNMHFLMPLPGTPLEDCRPRFLSEAERRKLDNLAQQGIVRGRWRRQEEMSRDWLDRRESGRGRSRYSAG